MSITVRYFASLKDSLGKSEDRLDVDEQITVAQLWQNLHPDKPIPENVLAAVNMEYVSFDYAVTDGDEVAFFPPVTGGAI
ncbi:MAG: molybdopterin converting factor subunit 1 [Methylomicrobium sp.]